MARTAEFTAAHDAVAHVVSLYGRGDISYREFERRMFTLGLDWFEVQELRAEIEEETGQFGMGA